MKRLRLLAVVILLFSVTIFYGCGGGGARVEARTTNITLGQQLIDLDAAYKSGAMTEKEYKSAKSSLLKKYR